jgi:hypothetical protein
MRTAEEITGIAEKKSQTSIGQRRVINRLFRNQDDSNKWPINNKFDVTERAIRHAHMFERQSDVMSSLEYALFLERDTSQIVNDEKNW